MENVNIIEQEVRIIPASVDADSVVIERLAGLSVIEYERERDAAAKELRVRAAVLDGLVKNAREKAETNTAVSLCADIEPSADPVNLADLLTEVRGVIHRFIVCERHTATAATLWIAFTWVIENVGVAPIAAIVAPEKRCGKSQLLDVIGRLSRRKLYASNISTAALFRVVEAVGPTLLIDEADSFFKANEELRGIVNSGHTRTSAFVLRTVGDNHEVRQFSTWGAKAIAGIGHLPETVMDRSIILSLRRRLPDEKVDRIRHAAGEGLFETLAAKLARFAADYGRQVGQTKPKLPAALNDRAGDNWEPLLTIAEVAGGDWPKDAERAALAISGSISDTGSATEELLGDIREIFEANKVDRIAGGELLERLVADTEAPWATWNRGRPMSGRQLIAKLKEFDIYSRPLRIGYDTVRGFTKSAFADAWKRYLNDGQKPPQDVHAPENPKQSATSLQESQNNNLGVTNRVSVGRREQPFVAPNILNSNDSNVVTHESRKTGEREGKKGINGTPFPFPNEPFESLKLESDGGFEL